MANELPNGNGAGAEAAPSLNALIQYTKDFSFENPKAPRSLAQQDAQQGPQMSLQVNVGSTALGDNDYETVLRLEGKAEVKGETLFAFDLTYAGVFRLQNIPQEHVHPVLVIDCARLLFPFARQIIAEAVQNGGFRPSTCRRSTSPRCSSSACRSSRPSRALRPTERRHIGRT